MEMASSSFAPQKQAAPESGAERRRLPSQTRRILAAVTASESGKETTAPTLTPHFHSAAKKRP